MKRFSISLLLMLGCTLACGQQKSLIGQGRAEHEAEVCRPESLPKEIKDVLKEKFGGWTTQEPTTLGQHARERWQSEKPLQCPGIAHGLFDSGKEFSYAVLVVPQGPDINGYKFLLFKHVPESGSYKVVTLDQSDKAVPANFFLRTISLSKFFDEQSKRSFQPKAKQGILLIDSGESEYQAEVYFLDRRGYDHQPVDY